MTDSEKLDLLLSEIQGMKGKIQGIEGEIRGIKEKADKLALGQLEIRKEMYMLNRKISDTYNVALDALAPAPKVGHGLKLGH